MRNAMGPMLMLAAISPLSAHAAGAAGQIVLGAHHQTHADQTLQNDVLGMAHNAVPAITMHYAGQQAIACGRMELQDTVVTTMPASGAWRETWTWRVCDTMLSLPIDFKPSPQGGTDFTFAGREARVAKATN